MVKLRCMDHGFECYFEVEGENISDVIERFGNHVSHEHGIKYAEETLTQFIVAQECYCPYCNSKFENKELLSKHIDRIHHGAGILEGDTRQF